jgi:acetylornithine aminotransferase
MAGLEALDGVAAVRGRGLMVAAQLSDGVDANEVQQAALGEGLIVNVPASGTLRLLPPLVVSSEQIDEAVEIVAAAL